MAKLFTKEFQGPKEFTDASLSFEKVTCKKYTPLSEVTAYVKKRRTIKLILLYPSNLLTAALLTLTG